MPRIVKRAIFYPLATILALGALYAAIPSYRYFWDSLIDCRYIETKVDLPKLVNPLHPLFPLAAYPLFRTLQPDIAGHSINMFRIVSIIFSLIGLITFYAILRKAAASHVLCAIATLSLGLTASWWHYSISGNTVVISMAFLLLSLLFYMPRSDGGAARGPMILHRLFFAISVLFSRLNFLFIIPFAVTDYIKRHEAPGSGAGAFIQTLKYSLVTLLCAAVPFFLLPAVSLGIWTPAGIGRWFNDFPGALPHITGDAADRLRGLLAAGLGNILALSRDANFAFKAYQGAPPNLRSMPYFIAFIFLAISFLAGIVFIAGRRKEFSANGRILASFCIGTILIVGGYFLIRQPFATTIFALPSLAMLFSLWALQAMRGKPRVYSLLWLLLPLLILTNNWFIKFNRDRFPDNNPYIYEASSVPNIVKDGDLLIDSGVNEGLFRHAYLLYFAGIDSRSLFQIPGVMNRDFEAFSIEMTRQLESGHKILIHEDAVQNEESMKLLIGGMGADYTPDELLDFIGNVIEPRYYFVINAKKYYVFERASEGVPPEELPMLPVMP